MTVSAPATAVPRAGRREWAGLAVLGLPTLLLSLDLSVLHLAAPHLSADLGPSTSQLLWILDIYGFMIAGFLVTMGTLGDRIGRRRLLLIGATAFGAASVLAAYATSPAMLIAARAVLGIAGATLMPSTLALIRNMFQDARQRATAVGVWMTCFLAGSALGPVLGGVLLEWFWWGSVFLAGVPVMVILLISAPLLLPEYRDREAGRLDLFSVLLSMGAMMPVIYGLKKLAEDGVRAGHLLAVAVGLLVGLLFVHRQRRLAAPLLDLRLFRNPVFGGTLAFTSLTVFASGGMLMFLVQYLQMVEDKSPLEAGIWMLPATAVMIVATLLVPAMARRTAPVRLVAGGMAVAALGYLLATRTGGDHAAVIVVTGLAFAYLGAAPMMVLGTDMILSSAPQEKAGSASSLSETSGELGMAMGIAVLGSVGTAVYRREIDNGLPDGLPADSADAAADSLPNALSVAGQLPDGVGALVSEAARAAFTSGVTTVAWVSAGLMAVLSLTAWVLLRRLGVGTEARTEDT
ncbi:MFS transporter [Streptomyces johnsoniae]|uniref:MFS transporter n=1 Tax=Streptomyces johnsoniae TaxID=3075532 RepID=A0ABU2S9M6_9ACTN|nr:MFS transporter [Streptomyces sp. DSM 41886]MDT0445381.1 MFS transporter [Streptomyces sp. DSM 41886]